MEHSGAMNTIRKAICLLLLCLHTARCADLRPGEEKSGAIGIRKNNGGPGEFSLTILHVNDVHARFEETNAMGGRCTKKSKCYGGFARIRSKVAEIRTASPASLFLAAGDYFQGTIWYTVHKHSMMSALLNMMDQSAMSLGNHEFDDGVENLAAFLKAAKFPVLAANVDTSKEPSLGRLVKKSVVIEVDGRKVGVVGYLTTETASIANTGQVSITDEVEAVRAEAARLRRQGVTVIVALGHAGFGKDKKLALAVKEVDVVVGGHTNTFLFSGREPDIEKSMGDYPTVLTRPDGTKVLVVQAYAFGKYLGRLDVTFDGNGKLVRWKGKPILLDQSEPKDLAITQELARWRKGLKSALQRSLGSTRVFLDGGRNTCRVKECNMGNLLADAMVYENAKYPDGVEWARTSLAIIQSGGIRSSIDERDNNGSVTMEDVLTVAPFQNTIDIVTLLGKDVFAMFEHAVKDYDTENPGGKFLQVSGFKVVFDLLRAPGSRVVTLLARCSKCRVPVMAAVQRAESYDIAMPAYLARGGDDYKVIRDNKIRLHPTGLLDSDLYAAYITRLSPIVQGVEGRVSFTKNKLPTTQGPCSYSLVKASPTH